MIIVKLFVGQHLVAEGAVKLDTVQMLQVLLIHFLVTHRRMLANRAAVIFLKPPVYAVATERLITLATINGII